MPNRNHNPVSLASPRLTALRLLSHYRDGGLTDDVLCLIAEPLLEAVDLCFESVDWRGGLDWVICGGESGPNARPCQIEWIESLVRQCGEANVPCFVKQLGSKPMDRACAYPSRDRKGGEIEEFPADLRVREFPQSSRLLDGRTWDETPTIGANHA